MPTPSRRVVRRKSLVVCPLGKPCGRALVDSVEELPLDDIAIARGVTHEDLARVPDEWLYGIRVVLRADRTLAITRLESNQHRGPCVELVRQLANFAFPHGMECGRELPATLGDGSVMRRDVPIYGYADPNSPVRVPLTLFEVEVHHRWTPGMIETATTYLNQLPSVVRVVFLRYFDPRGEDHIVMNRLCVPAILVVFDDDDDDEVY